MGAIQAKQWDDLSRRQLARRGGMAVVAGAFVPLGGCLGRSPLTVEGVETEVSDGSTVVALVGVTNDAGSTTSAAMTVQCNVLSGDTYTERREIAVLANQTASYEFRFQTRQSELGNDYQVATNINVKGPLDSFVDWLQSF